jgi:hypothetical protein
LSPGKWCTSRCAEEASPRRDGYRVDLEKQFPHNVLRRITATVLTTIDATGWLSKYLEENDPELVRAMLQSFARRS